ncbi:MAG: carbohydrate kinase family protein [Promethearchaeota archaeon]
MKKKSKVLILGSLAYDYLMHYPDFFEKNIVFGDKKNISGSFVIDNFKIRRGGTAGNISYNIGKMKISNILISAAGRDFDRYGSILEKMGTDLRVDIYENENTAACYILSDKEHNQIIIFCAGALQNLNKIKIPEKIYPDEKIKIAINAPNPIDAMKKFSYALEKLEIPMIFDPGQQINEFSRNDLLDILKKSDYLILNNSELEILKKKTNLAEIQINQLVNNIIATFGAKGSKIYKNDDIIHIPAAKAKKVLDTTGAGDAYRAGLLSGIFYDLNLEESCKLGSIVGSFAVESFEPQNQDYNFEDVKTRYEENFGKFPLV